MKRIWEKRKIWITVLGYVALVFAFFYFGVVALIGKIRMNSDEVQKRLIDEEVKEAKLAKIPEMERNHEAFGEKDLKAVLASEREIDFIKKLESLAEETGNEIDLKIKENDDQKEASKLPKKDADKEEIKNNLPSDSYLVMLINLEGNYSGLVNFIHKLENAENYVNIVSIESKKEKAANSSSQSASFGSPFFAEKTANEAGKNKKKGEKEAISSSIEAVVYLEK